MVKAIICDPLHINVRNFASIFGYTEKNKVELKNLSKGKRLWNRYGKYSHINEVRNIVTSLKSKNKIELRNLAIICCGVEINLFESCFSEILTYVLPNEESWYEGRVSNNLEEIFEKLYSENNELLLQNLAAAMLWCRIYDEELIDINDYSFAVVFSGSQIYQKIFSKLIMAKRPKLFITESFMTGNEFYWEERYTPVSNQCDIRFDNVYHQLQLPSDLCELEAETVKAVNKFFSKNNLNVRQPEACERIEFACNNDVILIAAQVQNDFSIIESELENLNILDLYKGIIKQIIKYTDLNIVVKTHPYEKYKININRSFVSEELNKYVGEMPADDKERIVILEDSNLKQLLNQVDGFLTINSQASFEACFYEGFKPIVVGKPFYGGRGFCSEFASVDDLVRGLTRGGVRFRLDLEEYQKFLTFWTKLVQCKLCSVHPSGITKITNELRFPKHIPLNLSGAKLEGGPQIERAMPENSVESIYRKACEAFHQSEFLVALELFLRAERGRKNSANLKRCVAEVYVQLNLIDKALGKLDEAFAIIPENRNLKRRIRVLRRPVFRTIYWGTAFPVPK